MYKTLRMSFAGYDNNRKEEQVQKVFICLHQFSQVELLGALKQQVQKGEMALNLGHVSPSPTLFDPVSPSSFLLKHSIKSDWICF